MNKSPWHEANKERLREYQREYAKKYRAANREKLREACRKWYLRNRETQLEYSRKRYVRKRSDYLEKRYGLSTGEYEKLLAGQNGVCAICLANEPGGRFETFHIDHCHATGNVRGLLCNSCNHMLGNARDRVLVLEAAARYLTSPPACEILRPTMP